MPSIHSWKSRAVAESKGAWSAQNRFQWEYLTDLSKRELVEVCFHLAAICCDDDSYDDALGNGEAFKRITQEVTNLRAAGLI